MEILDNRIKGIYRDLLKGKDNNIIFDSGWVANTILDRCRILLAGFMKNGPTTGIQYLAVAQGLEEWDITGPTSVDPAETIDLHNRFEPGIPVSEMNLVYLDEDNTEVPGPTSRLQITAALNPGYPTPIPPLTTYPLREFGLFGSFNGTDYLINCIRHPVIHKDESATLIRLMRLYF